MSKLIIKLLYLYACICIRVILYRVHTLSGNMDPMVIAKRPWLLFVSSWFCRVSFKCQCHLYVEVLFFIFEVVNFFILHTMFISICLHLRN